VGGRFFPVRRAVTVEFGSETSVFCQLNSGSGSGKMNDSAVTPSADLRACFIMSYRGKLGGKEVVGWQLKIRQQTFILKGSA
jgi:hypothetical protein